MARQYSLLDLDTEARAAESLRQKAERLEAYRLRLEQQVRVREEEERIEALIVKRDGASSSRPPPPPSQPPASLSASFSSATSSATSLSPVTLCTPLPQALAPERASAIAASAPLRDAPTPARRAPGAAIWVSGATAVTLLVVALGSPHGTGRSAVASEPMRVAAAQSVAELEPTPPSPAVEAQPEPPKPVRASRRSRRATTIATAESAGVDAGAHAHEVLANGEAREQANAAPAVPEPRLDDAARTAAFLRAQLDDANGAVRGLSEVTKPGTR